MVLVLVNLQILSIIIYVCIYVLDEIWAVNLGNKFAEMEILKIDTRLARMDPRRPAARLTAMAVDLW
jgi:hypothetical protein